MERLTLFQKNYKHGTIDVWWLYDDGGLTLLLPYIINSRSNYSSCKLRVFAVANRKDDFNDEQRRMAELLAKFRIDYTDLIMIDDITKRASDSTREFFNGIIKDFKGDPSDSGEFPAT